MDNRIRTYKSNSRSKYGNVKFSMDGFTFDSKAEARRYAELKILLREGVISNLELQKEFELQPAFRDSNGKMIRPIYYRADFVYTDNETGKTVVEDVKGYRTEGYKLKKKMMAYRGYVIQEI